MSKITNSSDSNTPSTSASTSSKPAESETNQDSSSSDTPSDCSSPDSLKTELIFFKPIIREPKTPSAKPVLLRVPSIRSAASSTDRFISSPCPSPFFIPITPRRQSAFSFVGMPEDDYREDGSQSSIIKPKATKRKSVKSSPEKPAAKRAKQEVQTNQKSVKPCKPGNVSVKQSTVEAKAATLVGAKRKTRSTDKNDDDDFQKPKCLPPKSKRKPTENQTIKTSPQKKEAPVMKKYQQTKKTPPVGVLKEQPKRVTRSQSIKQ